MKTVCSKHERAYEVGTRCPYCEEPTVSTESVPDTNSVVVEKCTFTYVIPNDYYWLTIA